MNNIFNIIFKTLVIFAFAVVVFLCVNGIQVIAIDYNPADSIEYIAVVALLTVLITIFISISIGINIIIGHLRGTNILLLRMYKELNDILYDEDPNEENKENSK
uniref:Lipopolysaccharide assembly protein A domain-containing protein n=1 Tax=Geladintestivirus 1 TaxID=3233133 RepID=A0AAU8MIJ3_9CAUD